MATAIQKRSKKRKKCRLTDSERYVIGKYAAIHEPIAAVKKVKKSHPHLVFGQSTARSPRKKYHDKLKLSEQSSELTKKQVGRQFMLGALDENVRHFLMIVRRKGVVVNTVVGNVTARVINRKK